MNRAAAAFLGADAHAARGRYLQEVVRSAPLAELQDQALHSDAVRELEFALHAPTERVIRAYGRQLADGAGQPIGALIALNDVTRLRRLENVRREFVANVSHELRTPITAIQGFVDTLLEGAMEQPEDRRRFLEIIARQTKRLSAIIEDLLALARLEHEPQKEAVQMERGSVLETLRAAVEQNLAKARRKGISLELECPAELMADMNSHLVEQAVANLIDNAVKHSSEGASVRIKGYEAGDWVRISVSDRGCGIEPEHLPRLFERFYRVDKARSRASGGTGLGLSLVKHIAEAHGGRAEVESKSGEGSTFTVSLRSRR